MCNKISYLECFVGTIIKKHNKITYTIPYGFPTDVPSVREFQRDLSGRCPERLSMHSADCSELPWEIPREFSLEVLEGIPPPPPPPTWKKQEDATYPEGNVIRIVTSICTGNYIIIVRRLPAKIVNVLVERFVFKKILKGQTVKWVVIRRIVKKLLSETWLNLYLSEIWLKVYLFEILSNAIIRDTIKLIIITHVIKFVIIGHD